MYTLPHPGYTPPTPPSHTGHRWSTTASQEAALERAVVELTVRKGRVTVPPPVSLLGLFSTRFTVGLLLSEQAALGPCVVRECCQRCAEWSPSSDTRFTVGLCSSLPLPRLLPWVWEVSLFRSYSRFTVGFMRKGGYSRFPFWEVLTWF